MKFSNIEVFNINGAMRGMRNPKNSWHKADTVNDIIGSNDMKLAQTLILAGKEHSKFMRQILVSVDITAPLYWWKEFDTYKVGTTANSTSTMHKLSETPITRECFEMDDFNQDLTFTDCEYSDTFTHHMGMEIECHIRFLESLRLKYLETKDVRYWKELIRWLPSSWLQTRTITMSYANVREMFLQREHHPLTEWKHSFCVDFIDQLPYSEELIKLRKQGN